MAIAINVDGREAVEQTIETLDLAAIKPAPDNPRRDVGDISELAASMSELGIIQPLFVTPRDGMFMIVCGHRRYAAARKAKLTVAPVIVRELTEEQRIKAMLVENCQREDLSPLEEGRGYQQLVELGMSQRQIGADVGKSQGHISKRLALLALPQIVQARLDAGGITVAVGLELAKLADHPDRIEAVLKDETFDGQVADIDELGWAIENELAAIKRAEKIEAAKQQLAADGVRVLELAGGHGSPKGTIGIRAAGGYDYLKFDPAKHASEPCHAAAVDSQGDVFYLCTDRKRHPKLKTISESYRSTSSSAAAQQKAEHRELFEASKTRREFTSTLLTKRVPQADVLDLAVDAFIEAASHSEAMKIAARLLGIEPEKTKQRGSFYASQDFAGALRAHAAQGDKQRAAVLLALAAGTNEEFMIGPWNGWAHREAWVGFLEKNGYTVAPIEAKKLGRKTTSRRKAA